MTPSTGDARTVVFPVATNDTSTLIRYVVAVVVESLYRKGYRYKRIGLNADKLGARGRRPGAFVIPRERRRAIVCRFENVDPSAGLSVVRHKESRCQRRRIGESNVAWIGAGIVVLPPRHPNGVMVRSQTSPCSCTVLPGGSRDSWQSYDCDHRWVIRTAELRRHGPLHPHSKSFCAAAKKRALIAAVRGGTGGK